MRTDGTPEGARAADVGQCRRGRGAAESGREVREAVWAVGPGIRVACEPLMTLCSHVHRVEASYRGSLPAHDQCCSASQSICLSLPSFRQLTGASWTVCGSRLGEKSARRARAPFSNSNLHSRTRGHTRGTHRPVSHSDKAQGVAVTDSYLRKYLTSYMFFDHDMYRIAHCA